MNNFRVTLFLQNFFSDQRSSCRVYITSQMKSVQDLQNHINDIFHLDKDFYLTSNNLYLPNAEDIRILKEDDIVTAVPYNLTAHLQSKEVADSNKSPEIRALKRKRSNSIIYNESIVNNHSEKKKCKKSKLEDNHCINDVKNKNNELMVDNCCTKKKKCKKSKSEDITTENNYIKKKKTKKNKEKVDKTPHNEADERKEKTKAEDSFISTQENHINNLSKTIPSSSPLRLLKSKKIEPMKISMVPKIIKTIHVYDHKPIINNKIINVLPQPKECKNEGKNLEMVLTVDNSEEGLKVIQLSNDYLVESPKKLNVNEDLLRSQVNNCDGNFTNNENTNEFVSNEKLTSTNKLVILSEATNNNGVSLPNDEKCEQKSNQTKNNEDHHKEITENRKVHVLENVCVQSAIITDKDSTRNSVISTEDFSESIASITADEASLELCKPKRKRKRTRRKKVKESVENSVFETSPPVFTKPITTALSTLNKHIKFEDDDEDKMLADQQIGHFQTNINNSVNCETFISEPDIAENTSSITRVIENGSSPFSYEKLCNEEIMKYPVMVDIYPKVGDIIAFKIYILSEQYTPEISNFIIAKVVNYDTEYKIVSLRFLVGGEQCTEPEGKFHMDIENYQHKNSGQFSWDTLKEPRLLFP